MGKQARPFPFLRPSPADHLARLYAALHPELLRFARARAPVDVAAEDIVQQVWTAFAKSKIHASKTGNIAQPRAWLYRALRNALTDKYRREARRPAIVPLEDLRPAALPFATDPATDISDASEDGDTEFWRKLNDALAQLPAPQREVAERHLLDGESLTDLAAELHVPVRTLISRKRYARQRLQVLLRDTYDDFFGVD